MIDRLKPAFYSWNMNSDRDKNALDVAGFAAELGELMDLCEKLHAENEQLRSLNARLQTEKAQLMRRNQLSQDKIEGMITRLKTMELEL